MHVCIHTAHVSDLALELVQASVSGLFDGAQHLGPPLLQGLKQPLKVLVGPALCELAVLLQGEHKKTHLSLCAS